MQLVLSIDDIGLKNNMSSEEETNQSEKKIKTEIIDISLNSSPTPSKNIQEDQIVEHSQNNIAGSNGTALCDDENSNKSNATENQNSPEKENESTDINTNEIKAEIEDELSEKCLNECQETKSSGDDFICEKICDKNKDSDIGLSVKNEKIDMEEQDPQLEKEDVQEEKINEEEVDSTNYSNMKESDEENIHHRDEIKKESHECETSKEVKANNAAGNTQSDDELSEHQESHEDAKECSAKNGTIDNISSTGEHKINDDDIKTAIVHKIDDDNVIDNLVNENKIDNNDVSDNAIANNIESYNIEGSKNGQLNDKKTIQDSDEVIDIADERDSDSIENEDGDSKIENKPTHTNEGKAENKCVDDDKLKGPITIDDDIIDIADEKDSCDSVTDKPNILRNILESDVSEKPLSPINEDIAAKNTDLKSLNETSHKGNELLDKQLRKSESTDKPTSYKLSNTLDILSDEEEESSVTKPDSPKPVQEPETNDKQCINIEEDDDIMVIDDESSAKDAKDVTEVKKTHSELTVEPPKNDEENVKDGLFATQQNINKDLEECKISENNTEIKKSEIIKFTFPRTPLLSSTALKSFKKNLSEMTRNDLEDFCILTIAEAIFDRSNLGELKSQMKLLTQHLEENKLKAKSLAKQNRDLQVVLKSIQEEQKKNSEAPITPLKITRSVGMQVLMTDKGSRKRQAVLSAQMLQNSTPTKPITPAANKAPNKPASSPNVNSTKTPPRQTQQQIPVPRLVPAPATKPSPSSSPQANDMKSPAHVPNGVKTAPSVAKPEKRSHTKMQQSSAVTVDLTDDEPPSKVISRSLNSPVRCVPPQSLLAPRPSLPMTSPRKVYIPISGQQAQNIRPGQHIMLKSVTGYPGTPRVGRPRAPTNIKVGSNQPVQIRPRQRHPAPLPELMKQCQPPNWKALPPAPELKLAKVENGIVISWKIDGYREDNHEEIASYQLFAYQETSQPPSTSLWKKIGDVKALPLPMACTLTQFMSGYKYYFAVRAVDVKSRFGPFSLPGSILLLKN